MPNLTVVKTLLRELVTTQRSPRVPEPDLVMDDPDKVAAFERAGREDGALAGIYLFHCAQICEILCPGDTVVDLGCGPANQLGLVARLNPESQFIGLDLSEDMLERAQAHVNRLGLKNIEFRRCDMTRLDFLDEQSVDAVFSTVSLHHLPSVDDLGRTFSEVNRVLRPQGGLYLVDFGHLKSEKSILDLANLYADRQPELFTLDYLASLRAAFHLPDFKRLVAEHFESRARLCSTFLAPFLVAVKSPCRREPDEQLRQALLQARQELPLYHQRDLKDLIKFFQSGGLKSNLLDKICEL